MALRIPIPAGHLAAGLDSLVVFGVVRSLTRGARPPTQLADLLDAHHYTDGLAFVRPGTPTNNTDDRRAGYSSDDPGHERSFAIEVDGHAARSTTTTRCASARRSGFAFDRILPTLRPRRARPRARRPHMRSMNTALWQVGWGYFLSNMIGTEAGLTPAGPRVGAAALPRSRAQLRTVAGAALRRAAVRPPAGDVARSLAARRR